MWVIVLTLVNVMLYPTLDARAISSSDKEKLRTTTWEHKFERSQKRQKISGELEIDGQKFESLGCWKDAWSRSLPTLEGEHYLLMDPNYKGRKYALFKCARAALDKGYKLFGIENGGQCFASSGGDKRYHKYGVSKECRGDGKGGPWSIQVYRFLEKDPVVNGAYSSWSSWGTCTKSCLGGVRRRVRTCTNPAPSRSGRECGGLGSSVESQDCNVKSCPDDSETGDHKSRGKVISSKRDGSQIQPSQQGFGHSSTPTQLYTEFSGGRKPAIEYQHSERLDGQETRLNHNGEKYIALSPFTKNNAALSNVEDEKQTPVSIHKSNKEPGQDKTYSVANNGHGSQEKIANPFASSEQQDVSQEPSLHSASHVEQDVENDGEKEKMPSQEISHVLKQPVLNSGQQQESHEQGNVLNDQRATQNKFGNSMQLSTNATTPKNEKEESNASPHDYEQFKDESKVPRISQDMQIASDARPSHFSNTNSFNVEKEKLGNDAGSVFIPTDKIHDKVENLNDRQKGNNEFSSVGESINAVKPGFSDKVPTDAAIQGQNVPEQQYKTIADVLGHDQGIEIRIRPEGNFMNTPLKNSQNIITDSHPEDVVSSEQKSDEMSQQDAQQHEQDQRKAPAKGQETESSSMQSSTSVKNDEEHGVLHEGRGSKRPTSAELNAVESQKQNSENYRGTYSVDGSHEYSTESKQNAVSQPETAPPHHEKQESERKIGKESSTSNEPQGQGQGQASVSHQGERVADKNQFTSAGNALMMSKEKPDASQSSIHQQPNPNKEDDRSSAGKENQSQQISHSSKPRPFLQGVRVHRPPENTPQTSDQEKQPAFEGEPVPVVDLSNLGQAGGADYEPTSNEALSGPPEDAREPSEPVPDSQGESQPPGPVYDNQAIQGISEMSQRMDETLMQHANSPGNGAGFDELSMSKGYTEEFPTENRKQGLEDEATMQARYQYQKTAPMAPGKYDSEFDGGCLCPKKECSAKADIAFLVDGSSNIPQPYYARVLEFIKILSRGFDKYIAHVGMVTYGDDVKVAINLKALTDFKQFDDAVNVAPYMGGKAHTGNALAKLKAELFGIFGRQDAPRALILLSSGGSVDDVVAPGLELRDSGIKVTAIGLGKQANVRELITIASEPKSEHVFTAFLDTLPDTMDQIIQGICKDVMGIVRDRQEPCTCETNNGQVGSSYEYTREPPSGRESNTIGGIAQEGQMSSFSQDQGRGDGAVDQNENLNPQNPVGYQPDKSNVETAFGSKSDNSLDKTEDVIQTSETDYVSEQQNAHQGDPPGKFSKEENSHGQVFAGEEERPSSSQLLKNEEEKPLNEKEKQQNTGDSIDTDESSTYPGFRNDGRNDHLKSNSFGGAQPLVPANYRFAAGLPERFKPHSGDGDGATMPSHQLTDVQRVSNESPLKQGMLSGKGNQFPWFSRVNQERVQGGASHVHEANTAANGNDDQGTSLTTSDLGFDFRGPTKVIAVDKEAESVNKLQKDNRPACTGVNLGVVVDSTASFGGRSASQATQMMDLAKRVSHLFPISPRGNSVGMIVYGGFPQPSIVSFDKFLDQKSMDEAIENASNPNLEIRIGKALTGAQKHLFNDLSMSKRNVLLLVTDGTSFDDVNRPAVELKRRGIEIFCLGIGNEVSREQLDSVASEPKKSHVFWAPYNDAEKLMGKIKNEICLAVNKSTGFQTKRKCPSDVGFIIDGSRSVEVLGKGNFKKMLDFVKNVSFGFNISPNDTRVGAITYGADPHLAIPFEKYTSPNRLTIAFEKISYPGTIKMTGKALDLANQQLFDQGSRERVPKVLVVLSQGTSKDKVEKSAEALHKAGVTVISVGLGPVYNDAELKTIASMPVAYHVIKAKFNELRHKVHEVQDKICAAAKKYTTG